MWLNTTRKSFICYMAKNRDSKRENSDQYVDSRAYIDLINNIDRHVARDCNFFLGFLNKLKALLLNQKIKSHKSRERRRLDQKSSWNTQANNTCCWYDEYIFNIFWWWDSAKMRPSIQVGGACDSFKIYLWRALWVTYGQLCCEAYLPIDNLSEVTPLKKSIHWFKIPSTYIHLSCLKQTKS